MQPIKKIILTKEGNKFYIRDMNKDFHTQFGYIKKEDLSRKNAKTNTGKEVNIIEPSFIDLYRKIKRAPQIIPLKDVALIAAETGINKKSVVVDAGTGSGALAFFLANIAKKVISYEIREDFFKIAKENVEFLGLKNINLKNKDVYNGIDEKNVDLITLDLPEPWKCADIAAKALKAGGFLAVYSPTIPQISDFIEAVGKSDKFVFVKAVELLEREWEFEGRKIRPMSRMMGHSGFLCFVRRA